MVAAMLKSHDTPTTAHFIFVTPLLPDSSRLQNKLLGDKHICEE